MANNHHVECYGTLFPDVLHLPEDRPASGTVFTALLQRAGGMYRCSRSVTADMEQWDRCQQCPDFDGCSTSHFTSSLVSSLSQPTRSLNPQRHL